MNNKTPHSNTPINQHYVPQCYLRYFTNKEGLVWVYNKISNKKYQTKVERICSAKNYHTMKTAQNKYGMEKIWFAGIVEPLLKKVIENIVETKQNYLKGKNVLVSEELLFNLATLIVVQYFRVPAQKEKFINLYDSEAMSDFISRTKEELIGLGADPIIRNFKPHISDPNLLHAQFLLNKDIMETIINELYQEKNWIFILSGTGNFCTSDNPVYIAKKNVSKNKKSLGNLIFFPLTSDILVMILDKRENHYFKYLDRSFIRCPYYENFINSLLFNNSKIFVIKEDDKFPNN